MAAGTLAQEPATLGDAIASEPMWLLTWIAVLVGTHFLALAFVAHRDQDQWRLRWEPMAIVVSFMIAGTVMEMLYARFGYVRLLGLAHLIGWLPIYSWLLYRRRTIGLSSLWGRYVHLYLAVAGLSLIVDAADVVRFLVGDSASLHLRWGT